MRFFRKKSAGFSLLIALGVSTIVLGIATEILLSVSRTFEQTTNIERANQAFFATESGLEAGFFHHNARGQGIKFADIENVDASQVLPLPAMGAVVSWTIDGRVDEAPFLLSGVLKEDQSIQIPFAWDGSTHAGVDIETTETRDKIEQSFVLTFFGDDLVEDTGDTVADTAAEAALGGNDNEFDFGFPGENIVVIDWNVSRTSNAGVESYIPRPGMGTDCPTGICKDALFRTTASIDSDDSNILGTIIPGLVDNTSLGGTPSSFVVPSAPQFEYKLSFRPVVRFVDEADDTKIARIPFTIQAADPIPRPIYTLTSRVDIGDFFQQISLDVPEKTSIGAFDYVIVD